MIDFNELAVFKLQRGGHKNADDGVCAMEAIAWLEGINHTDQPKCVCRVIASYVRPLNDILPDDQRQRLIPYLPRLVGTVARDFEQARLLRLHWCAFHRFLSRFRQALGHEPLHSAARDWKQATGWARELFGEASMTVHPDAHRVARLAGRLPVLAEARGDSSSEIINLVRDDKAWDLGIQLLDRMLAVGPQSAGFSRPIETRIAAYRELVEA